MCQQVLLNTWILDILTQKKKKFIYVLKNFNYKSMKINYSEQSYNVSGREGFTLSEALSLQKAKYSDIKDLKKDIIIHESLEDFGNFIEEMWDSIEPVTVKQALSKDNTEERRVYFDCIGIEKLFKSLEPTLRDKQTIKKKRTKWDDVNNPIEYEFEDVYELYEIDGSKLFEKDRQIGRAHV